MAALPIYGKKKCKNLQSRKVGDLGTWYVTLGIQGLPSLFKLMMNSLTSRSNLLPYALKWIFLKFIFLNTLKPKSLFSLGMLNLMRQRL